MSGVGMFPVTVNMRGNAQSTKAIQP